MLASNRIAPSVNSTVNCYVSSPTQWGFLLHYPCDGDTAKRETAMQLNPSVGLTLPCREIDLFALQRNAGTT